jgi:hypothetical protein
LDCRLYPFVLTFDPGGTKVILAMDMKCPYLEAHGTDPEVTAYAQRLASYLEDPVGLATLKTNPSIIGPSWPEFVSMAALPSITATLQESVKPPHPALRPFTMAQRDILSEALATQQHAYSGYTLAGILGWSDLIRYWWASLHGAVCLFAEQAGGLFMPLPPLGSSVSAETVAEAWGILTEANQGALVSRIEGIEPDSARLFETSGFRWAPGEMEYLYHRADLVNLRGDRYRSQRWAVNRCRKRVAYYIRPFKKEDLVSCLQMYTRWGIGRQQRSSDPFPKALVRDGLFFHRRLMMSFEELDLTGYVIEVEGEIRGYTFGAPVSPEIFCVFLEITDHSIPGLAQVLFREFCSRRCCHRTAPGTRRSRSDSRLLPGGH